MKGSCGELYGNSTTTLETVLFTIVNVVIIIVASALNITILILIKTRHVLHKPSFVLLAALACSDLLMVCLPGTLYLAITLSGNSNNGTIQNATCYIISSITMNNVFLLCCITQDRYQLIKHSMDSRPYTTKRRVAVKIAFCMITSILFSSAFFIETIYDLSFTTLELLFMVWLGCFTYIIVYYFKLSRVVRSNRMNSLPLGPRDSNGESGRRAPSQHSNLNRSIFLLIASYVIAFFPAAVITSIRNVSYRYNLPPGKGATTATIWSMMFSLLNSVMDPLIYTYRSDAIGRELRKVC